MTSIQENKVYCIDDNAVGLNKSTNANNGHRMIDNLSQDAPTTISVGWKGFPVENKNVSTSHLCRTPNQESMEEEELWTTECLVDQLFLCLAGIRQYNTVESGRTIPVRKYYTQARQLMKWIPISKPSPAFVINISDLTPKIKSEIASISNDPATLQYVLTQAVGRIFENLDFKNYHLSIARNVKVKFEA